MHNIYTQPAVDSVITVGALLKRICRTAEAAHSEKDLMQCKHSTESVSN